MSELHELTNGLNSKQLFSLLLKQLRDGETIGGTICSHIYSEFLKSCKGLKISFVDDYHYNRLLNNEFISYSDVCGAKMKYC